MLLAIGTVLENRYRIDALLSAGGMGAVYRAWDQRLRQNAAIKQNALASPASAKQFEREAVMMARLRHPNLPRVIDHFSTPDGAQYLVMDCIEGEDLGQMLERVGPLHEATTLTWIDQVCAALTYLHGQNPPVIHRDVKPSNIKITPQGEVFLVDFGIAKVGDARQRTATGALGVTPGYSPPEQYGMGGTDERSDVYALGATLYALLTGRCPPESILRMTKAATLTPPRALRPELSPAVASALESALNTAPTDRPQTVAEFQLLFTRRQPKQPTQTQRLVRREQLPADRTARYQAAGAPPPDRKISKRDGKEMVRVPEGAFLYGVHNETVELPAFWIDKTPVTNAEYARFVAATGHSPPFHLRGQKPPPEMEDHPVTDVSRYDAMIYAEWAGKRLPSAAEWEKAGRGTDGRRYPWGDGEPTPELCNFDHNIGGTTPVGRYSPQGDSPYGCVDMSGNVWEWTATERSSNNEKVIKGGAWLNVVLAMDIAADHWAEPGDKGSHIGFRCAWSSDNEAVADPQPAFDEFGDPKKFRAWTEKLFPDWNG